MVIRDTELNISFDYTDRATVTIPIEDAARRLTEQGDIVISNFIKKLVKCRFGDNSNDPIATGMLNLAEQIKNKNE